MTIDEEIKNFFLEIEIREQLMPDNSLPEYLKKIQHYILLTHSDLDIDMLVRILSQIRYEAGDGLNNETWDKINLLILNSLDEIPYMPKLNIVENYGDLSKPLIEALRKLNTLRNEFAHPKIDILIKKYDIKTQNGKDQIQSLIRALKNARDLFLEHTEKSEACKFYVKKQLESSK